MSFFRSLLIAISTYSAIPVPQFAWTEENLPYAICFFPAVGLICGAALFLWYELCLFFSVSAFFFALTAACLPLLISGGIHMDGYMDTVDALASHQGRERKLEILKDSHCGAFAVLFCAVYLLLQTGLFYELYRLAQVEVLCACFFLSRSLSAFLALNMPKARKNGMLSSFTKDTERKKASFATLICALLAAAAAFLLSPRSGAFALVFSLLCVLLYRRIAIRQFGGVTGDTAGFFLQLCELAYLLGAWIGGLVL